MSKVNIPITILSVLVGLFFGNAYGGVRWALLFGALSGAASVYLSSRFEATQIEVGEPAIARFLFQDVRAGALWLPVRLWVGLSWLDAASHKIFDPKWVNTGESLKAYWQNAVAIPAAPARPAITYDWWRGFLQFMLDQQAYTWFGKLIAYGELLVGLGLIVGGLVGIAMFFGVLMNTSFLLSGSVSSNPIMLLLGIGLILAWKVAGWIGLDRFLLPALGTPWKPGVMLGGEPILQRQGT